MLKASRLFKKLAFTIILPSQDKITLPQESPGGSAGDPCRSQCNFAK